MCAKRLGSATLQLERAPGVLSSASVAGKKEGEGPLKRCFDYISPDAWFGEKSWEKAESTMLRKCFSIACDKAALAPSGLDFILSGDLLNQCAGSAYALRDSGAPYLGLYGACSTMAESLLLASLLIDGGCAKKVAALTSSHFCSAERQFRFPLEYGSVRPPVDGHGGGSGNTLRQRPRAVYNSGHYRAHHGRRGDRHLKHGGGDGNGSLRYAHAPL